ncbi:unnamed protein product [marine sediment metagenome]|uniref:Uncharacterized protein n=1 Tax=marine sediment metagenome TaxID=412755 RepID=X1QUJ0_9ZZZZ
MFGVGTDKESLEDAIDATNSLGKLAETRRWIEKSCGIIENCLSRFSI